MLMNLVKAKANLKVNLRPMIRNQLPRRLLKLPKKLLQPKSQLRNQSKIQAMNQLKKKNHQVKRVKPDLVIWKTVAQIPIPVITATMTKSERS